MATIPGVSDGELIRTTWGDAVADELNTNTVKIAGSTMTGALTLSGTPSSGSHAATKTYVDGRAATMVSTNVTYSNAPGAAITGLTGTLALPLPAFAVNWQITWNYGFSGHSVGTEYRTRMINNGTGTPLAISGFGHYDAGESHTGVQVVFLGPVGTAYSIGFQLELSTASSNTNVSGLVVAVSCPA